VKPRAVVSLTLWAAGLSLGLAPFGPRGEDALGRLLADLGADRIETRNQAERRLPRHLLDVFELERICRRFHELAPEAALRVRAAISRTPACGALLLTHAVTAEPPVRSAATLLLEDLLTVVVASQREPVETDRYDPPVRRAFQEGAITGLSWPMGAELPLLQVLAWLQETVPVKRPLAIDPTLPPDRLTPVTPGELLPQAASGLLHRLLLSRGLVLEDLGLVFMVRDLGGWEHLSEARRVERLEPGEADGRELLLASILTRALVDPVNADAPALPAALFRALGLQDAARTAASQWPLLSGRPARWLAELSIGADAVPARLQLELLSSSSSDGSRLALLLHLGRLAPLARPLLGALLGSDDPVQVRAGCYLAARGRAVSHRAALERCLLSADAGVRVAAALALTELPGGFQESAGDFFETLSRGVPAAALRPALSRACALHLSEGATRGRQSLLTSEDPRAFAVGAALLGIGGEPPRFAARWLELDRPLALLAYALGATHPARQGPPTDLPTGRLAGALISIPEFEGALAEILARRIGPELEGASWLRETRRASQAGDTLMLRTLLARVARDLSRDESYPGSVFLRSALRPARELNEAARIAHDELNTALSTPDGGASVRLLDPARIPFAP